MAYEEYFDVGDWVMVGDRKGIVMQRDIDPYNFDVYYVELDGKWCGGYEVRSLTALGNGIEQIRTRHGL